jgi:hypothetical protein
LFEAIIGLPENLFAGTGIPATVLILNKAKRLLFRGSGDGRIREGMLKAWGVVTLLKFGCRFVGFHS